MGDGLEWRRVRGRTVTGGTVTDNGAIHVTGDSAINTAAVNGGQVTVDATKTLTLDNTTVTGTTIADNGTVKVDATKTLNLRERKRGGEGKREDLGGGRIIKKKKTNKDTRQ